MSFGRELARRGRAIRFDDLPADVVRLASQCLLDWVGVTVAGSAEPAVRLLRAETLPEAAPGPATLIGAGERVGLGVAALINGTAAHALDYDDVVPAMSGHPSAAVLAALLPVAEATGLDGRSFVAAFVAGFETECWLGRALEDHYRLGWHATGTLGTLGAAAATAHALGLDETAWQHALGIAATSAAGLRGVFGTMSKPLHAGQAAANGQRAARLAARGFTGNPDVFEAAHGFAATHAAGLHPERAFAEPYELRTVLFKYHAACYGAHASMDAVAAAVAGLPVDRIARVRLRVPAAVAAQCGNPTPTTALEAKFSLAFAVALVLGRAGTGPAGFSTESLADPRLRALAARVEVEVADGLPTFAAEAEVLSADGERHTATADVSIPLPAERIDEQQTRLEAKFAELAGPLLGDPGAKDLAAAVAGLAEAADLRPVAERSAPPGRFGPDEPAPGAGGGSIRQIPSRPGDNQRRGRMSDATSPSELLLLGASRVHRLQIEKLGELRAPLTLRQYRILQRICEGYTSVSDLSRLAHRSVPTVSESVDGLIKRGLLERAGSAADRRAVVLSLTPAGTKARKAAEKCLADLAASVFDSLSASKQKVLGELAQKMYDVSGSAMWGPDA